VDSPQKKSSVVQDATALWYVASGKVALQTESLPPCDASQVQVRSAFSALSRGTESLIFRGEVPAAEYERMRAPYMGGTFPFPVKYGYATVGQVQSGPVELTGKWVFSLTPHQDIFNVPAGAIALIPEGVPPMRAVLAANMETALNAVWDAKVGPGDRIVIVGGGVVGCLIAFLCGHLPGASVTLVDINPERSATARTLGVGFALPSDAPSDCDLVFHCSATQAGLATALDLAGEEATVLELSWYGAKSIQAPLGGAFHSRQLRLQSSQVGHVSASRRPRWTYKRRLGAALDMLKDARLDVLLAEPINFLDLPAKLPAIFDGHSGVLCQPIRYL
jgi:NADPH:quinone reductase-like Zn-dependent oxidoreductase